MEPLQSNSELTCSMSHPVRVRGLELVAAIQALIAVCRTPCGCVGWNILLWRRRAMRAVSHPVRVRGLEPASYATLLIDWLVAPRAGAWVGTSASNRC